MKHLLTVPAPAPWIRANQHKDAWRTRHHLTKLWREATSWQARRQHLPALAYGPVAVTATFHRDDKRLYDLDGMALTVKAAIDGLRDAGVLEEDHCRVIPELTLRAGEPWADAALVLTIETLTRRTA